MSDSQETTLQAPVFEVATLAGGCFWCLEAVFDELRGVSDVRSGYMGGGMKNPSYRDVCTGKTGHAEIVQVTFDPATIAFRDLLEVFFAIHDPTTLNRQGADVGTQYRSAIFYHSPEQRATAEVFIAELTAAKAYRGPDCHPGGTGRSSIRGRGLSPRVFQEQQCSALLPVCGRAKGDETAQGVLSETQMTLNRARSETGPSN